MFVRMNTPLTCFLSFGCVVAPLAAQSTWTVTTAGGVQAAINAATAGDVILLPNTGSLPDYYPFTVDKGLTIRGNGCTIGYDPNASTFTLAVSLPPGQRAVLDGLDLHYGYSPFGSLGCAIVVTGGTVSIERCVLQKGNGTALSVSSATVVVEGCQIVAQGNIGSGRGIQATASNLTLRDCIVRGADATTHPVTGNPSICQTAVQLTSSVLHAERTSFTGGSNPLTAVVGDGAHAIVADDSSVWLADCDLTGGTTTQGVGGTALVNNGSVTAELAQTTLVGGTPGGSASSGNVDLAAPLMRLGLAPAWQRGANSTLSIRCEPNAFYGVWFTNDVAPTRVPLVIEPVWFVNGFVVQSGVLDGAGRASRNVGVPNSVALQYVNVWCQAIGGLSLPLHASTVAGGMIR